MRYAFAILLALHGLIHLMGFVKSFYLTDINKQVLGISKPIGSFWLIVFILFVILSSQFLTHKKSSRNGAFLNFKYTIKIDLLGSLLNPLW